MKNKPAVIASLCALFVLMTASQQVLSSCREGLRLCAELLLPSLFPFFVISGLLARLGFPLWFGKKIEPFARRFFHVSGAGASAFVIGLCGGYPMGASYLAGMLRTGQISTEECSRLLAFCNNTGPAFFIGVVGSGIFGDAGIGLILYAIHACSAILAGFLFRIKRSPTGTVDVSAPDPTALPFSAAFSLSVRQAVESLLNVCAFVVCFTVFTGLLRANGWLFSLEDLLCGRLGAERSALQALFLGFFELGGGIAALRGQPASPLNLAIASAIVGWGGLSVHFQTLSLFSEDNIKSAPHTAGRLISACFGFLLTYCFFSLRS